MRYIATEDEIIALDNIERVVCSSEYRASYDKQMCKFTCCTTINIYSVGRNSPTEITLTGYTKEEAIAARKKVFNEIMEELKAVKISC